MLALLEENSVEGHQTKRENEDRFPLDQVNGVQCLSEIHD
jgi:hypothetical protein